MIGTILHAEAREGLAGLADRSIDCVLTSPPYWGCRYYGLPAVLWEDGSTASLGLEPNFERYLDHLIEVFDGVKRVLKDGGTVWVNLADVFASGSRARSRGTLKPHLMPGSSGGGSMDTVDAKSALAPASSGREFAGLQGKSLCMIPERFALRMIERGWILRNVIVWAKSNFLPASVKDRFACAHERIFLFAKSPRYSFDLDAVRVPHADSSRARTAPHRTFRHFNGARLVSHSGRHRLLHPQGKNPGDVWMIPTSGSYAGHPAAFPEQLCHRPILAGCPPGGVVLDPFAGSGTACVVAKKLGRKFIGIEANATYVASALERLKNTPAPTEDAGTSETEAA